MEIDTQSCDILEDSTFWSIIFDATEKTQRPFLERVIKSYKYYKNNTFSFKELLKYIHQNPTRFNKVKTDICIFIAKNISR